MKEGTPGASRESELLSPAEVQEIVDVIAKDRGDNILSAQEGNFVIDVPGKPNRRRVMMPERFWGPDKIPAKDFLSSHLDALSRDQAA